MVNSIANISFLLKKKLGENSCLLSPEPFKFALSITTTKGKSASTAIFQIFCVIVSILKLPIAKERASQRIMVNLKIGCEDRRRRLLCVTITVSTVLKEIDIVHLLVLQG